MLLFFHREIIMLNLIVTQKNVSKVVHMTFITMAIVGFSACSKKSTIEEAQNKPQKNESSNAIKVDTPDKKAEDKRNDPHSRFVVFTNESTGTKFYKFDDKEREHNDAESLCIEKDLRLPDSVELESLVTVLESSSGIRKEWLAGKLKSEIWAENGNQTAGWFLRVSILKRLTKYDYSARAGKLETRCVRSN
jgi:hypothetical protein